MKQEVIIEGMSCKNCAAHVTEAIKELQGVKKVKVDLKEKKAVVRFDEQQLSLTDIINKVNTDTVYHAS